MNGQGKLKYCWSFKNGVFLSKDCFQVFRASAKRSCFCPNCEKSHTNVHTFCSDECFEVYKKTIESLKTRKNAHTEVAKQE